jgi:hypothetical protein
MAAILLSTRSKEDVQEGTKRGPPEVNVLIQLIYHDKVLFSGKYFFTGRILGKLRSFRVYSVYEERCFSCKLGEKNNYFKNSNMTPLNLINIVFEIKSCFFKCSIPGFLIHFHKLI